MKIIFLAIILLMTSTASSETKFYLNGLFETFGSSDIEEMPNSPGELLINDDNVNVTRRITTCFSLTFCGPEITKRQSIIKIIENRVVLRDPQTDEENWETILLANNDRVILANATMLTDSITIENWEIKNSGGISSNYVLSHLYLMKMGFVMLAEGSTGNISISDDGKTLNRNLMVCYDGCEMPTNREFDITVVPGKKVFFTDKSTKAVIENLIINADYNAIVLYEKNSNMITVWKPM